MAETTVLRSSASPQNATPTASSPQAKTSGPHPIVAVVMGSGGKPQIGAQQNSAIKSVTILPKSAMGMRRTAGVPSMPLTPQVAARVAELGIMPAADGAPVAANAPRPLRTNGKHVTANVLTPDQMMLCRHLVDVYLRELPPGAENEVIAVTTLASLDGMLANAVAAVPAAPEGPPPMVEVTAPGAGQPPTTVVVGPRTTSASVSGPRKVERAKPPIDVLVHEIEADEPPDQASQSAE